MRVQPSQCLFLFATLSLGGAFAAGCGASSHSSVSIPFTVVAPTNFTTIDGPGGDPTTINGINNNGETVGFTSSNGVNANFVRTSSGTFTALNLSDPAGMANGINDSGTIAGVASGTAFQMTAGGAIAALTPPGSASLIAFGINNGGVVVGQFVASAAGNTPGFAVSNGTFTTIIPASAAIASATNVQGINNNRLAVGFYSADGIHQHGFAFSTATQTATLFPDPSTTRTMTMGLVLTQFLGLNDNGEAVGYYQTTNGSQFGFLFDILTQTYTFFDHPQAAQVNGVQITQITGVDNAGDVLRFLRRLERSAARIRRAREVITTERPRGVSCPRAGC